jgi:hypothetical protein
MSMAISFQSTDLSPVRRQAWRRIFGTMVQDARQRLDRSVETAAGLAGMEASEWAAVEAGFIPADPARLRSMATALELRFDQMATLALLCRGAWEG